MLWLRVRPYITVINIIIYNIILCKKNTIFCSHWPKKHSQGKSQDNKVTFITSMLKIDPSTLFRLVVSNNTLQKAQVFFNLCLISALMIYCKYKNKHRACPFLFRNTTVNTPTCSEICEPFYLIRRLSAREAQTPANARDAWTRRLFI